MSTAQKPALAFIDHSFHRKTRSNIFLREILEKEFTVDVYWDESWRRAQPGPMVDIEAIAAAYHHVILFQIFYTPAILQALIGKNVTIMPMYDAVAAATPAYWQRFSAFKFLCFCRENYHAINSVNHKSIYLQHYPSVHAKQETSNSNAAVYFWQRVNSITWDTVRTLLNPMQVSRVVINITTDPRHTFVMPSASDIALYNIEFVNWFDDQSDYFQLLQQIDIFIAPRPLEGIGLSFLEAMALGKVVIAADYPTANEYIDHNNGYLYDLDNPQRIDLSDFREKAAVSHRRFTEQAAQQTNRERQLLNFVKQDYV